MEILVVVVLVIASFAGTALIGLAIRAGAKHREAIKALAGEKGWRYELKSLSNGTDTVLSDEDEGWALTLSHRSTRSSSTTAAGVERSVRRISGGYGTHGIREARTFSGARRHAPLACKAIAGPE